jgi:hypothetical protein
VRASTAFRSVRLAAVQAALPGAALIEFSVIDLSISGGRSFWRVALRCPRHPQRAVTWADLGDASVIDAAVARTGSPQSRSGYACCAVDSA